MSVVPRAALPASGKSELEKWTPTDTARFNRQLQEVQVGGDRHVPVVAWPPRPPHRSTASWPPGEPHGRSGRFEVDRGATVPAGRAVEAQPRARGSCTGRQWRRYGQTARGHDERPARRGTDRGRRNQHREPKLTCFGE